MPRLHGLIQVNDHLKVLKLVTWGTPLVVNHDMFVYMFVIIFGLNRMKIAIICVAWAVQIQQNSWDLWIFIA